MVDHVRRIPMEASTVEMSIAKRGSSPGADAICQDQPASSRRMKRRKAIFKRLLPMGCGDEALLSLREVRRYGTAITRPTVSCRGAEAQRADYFCRFGTFVEPEPATARQGSGDLPLDSR